ncbi:MAG: flagellin [Selenomonadaceae bacterium]|nr:flagellin [Selenomonadaceae bacterium]
MTEAQAKSTIQNASISALQGVINGSDTTSDLVKALQMVSDVSSLFKGESDLKAALQTPANGTSANQYLITGVYDGSTKVGSTYKSTKMTGTGTTLNTNRTNAINTAANAIKGVSVTSITDNTTIKYKGGATSSTAAADTEWSDGKNYLKGLVAAAAKAEADNAPSLTGGGGNSDSGPAAFGSAKVGSNPSGLVYVGTDVGLSSAGDMVGTANGESGVTVTAASGGIYGQISGLTISITDSEGNVKKSANAALDDFRTTVYAKNKSDSNEMTFQVGAKANQSITVGLDDMRAEALGLKGNSGTRVSVATQDKANAAIAVFDNAIQKVLDQQATIGAIEARLEYTSQNLTTSSENVQAAESTIRDADMAKEMTNYTKNNVLLQASQSMLAQANQNSSAVLSLLQ